MSYLEKLLRSVSPYESSDKVALRDFQREYFGERSRQVDDSFFEWLFMRNPHAHGPSLWLCKRDGIVVGQQGSLPVCLKVDDAEYRASWVIDLMVRPEWRLKGVQPALFASYRESTDVMLGLGLEDDAYRAFRRGGWTEITRMSYFVRPLDPQACGAGLKAPKIVTRFAPRALFSGSAHLLGTLAGAAARASLEPVAAFDERIDALWAAASRDYPIVVKRDFAHLRWRFDESPQRALYQRYYLVRKGALLGYAVVRYKQWNGHLAASVADYFGARKSIAPLLALVFREANAQGAVAVFIDQVHAGSESVLKALGCLRVRASWRFMFNLRDRESPLGARLGAAQSWFVLPADSDYDHIVIAAEQQELAAAGASSDQAAA